MTLKKAERNSSIELLKILAIIIIIISHAVPYNATYTSFNGYIDINAASPNINNVILAIFRYFGQIGNAIFVICSAWFLVDSKSVNKKKVVKIIIDCFIISLIIFLSIKCFTTFEIPKEKYPTYLFPITHSGYWFITCYLLLYLIHPLLNMIIDKLNKTNYLKLNIALITLYSVLGLFINVNLYSTPLLGFIIIYFIVGFIKKYMHGYNKNIKLNTVLLLISTSIFVGTIFIINVLSLNKGENIGLLKYCDFMNPIILLISISAFNIFSSWNFKNKFINLISGLSLLIYFIHGNQLVISFIKGKYLDYFYLNHNYDYIILYVLLLAALFFIISIILGLIYRFVMSKTLDKIIYFIYDKLSIIINRIINKISNKIN